jgi:hypothetical protein
MATQSSVLALTSDGLLIGEAARFTSSLFLGSLDQRTCSPQHYTFWSAVRHGLSPPFPRELTTVLASNPDNVEPYESRVLSCLNAESLGGESDGTFNKTPRAVISRSQSSRDNAFSNRKK